jgi:hypothetical protein
LYPSKNDVYWKLTWALGALWFGIVLVLLLQDEPARWLVLVSLVYPLYYMGLSFLIDYRVRRGLPITG